MKVATDTMANKFSDDSILVLVSNAMDNLQQPTLVPYPRFCCDCIACSRAAASLHAYLHMIRMRNSASKDEKVRGTQKAVNRSVDKRSCLYAAVCL